MVPVRRLNDGRLLLESASKSNDNAEVYLSAQHAHPDRYTLVYHRNNFYEWVGSHWRQLPLHSLERAVERELGRAVYEKIVKDPETKEDKLTFPDYVLSDSRLRELLKFLTLRAAVDQRAETPAWIDADGTADETPEGIQHARNIIACRNVLLNATTRETYDLTPRFLNLFGVDLDYNPNTGPPLEWLKFLDSVWGDDPEAIATLQEIMGYLLTPRTEQHKVFLLVGPPRSGKGTITNIITTLLGGKNNVSSVTLSDLNTQFGLTSLVGKSLATMTDLRFRSHDDGTAISRLLAISGGDLVGIEQKYKDPISVTLSSRFLIASNELPQLRDESGAIRSRFVVLKMTKSFLDKEDRGLTDRLMAELPAIFNWALEGLDRLNARIAGDERKGFVQPASGWGELEVLGQLSSPISVFIDDCCEVDPQAEISRKEMFAAWGEWATEHGLYKVSEIGFGRNLRSAVPSLGDVKLGPRGRQVRHYTGIRLNETGREYLENAHMMGIRFGQGDTTSDGSGGQDGGEPSF